MFGLSFPELLTVGVIAIVLFGKRLPEVARSWGQQYAKFRKTLNDLQSQVNLHEIYDPRPSSASYTNSKKTTYTDYDDHDEATAPRFEPPPAAIRASDSSDAA